MPGNEPDQENNRIIMKIRRSDNIFDGPRRRRRLPVIRIALVVLVAALLALLWQRGGEKPVVHVEKAIPADRLGH